MNNLLKLPHMFQRLSQPLIRISFQVLSMFHFINGRLELLISQLGSVIIYVRVPLILPPHEPTMYLQANKDERWVETMNQELIALTKMIHGTLLTCLIDSRWGFKLKFNPDGSIQWHKARLVAKGYKKVEVVDYLDSFSSAAKAITERVFLTMAVSKGWPLLQLDVNNAFLHGHLDENVCMLPPEGYTAARSRQVTVMRSSPQLRHILDSLFTIKDMGHAIYFLGLELARSTHNLLVTQQKYLRDILQDTRMLEAKPTSTPLLLGVKLTLDTCSVLPGPGAYGASCTWALPNPMSPLRFSNLASCFSTSAPRTGMLQYTF
ncbi:UNVERIFIED_CONTAM: hypothetical protein Slati_2687300 [Sesamum latifolium]|uniref:Reverse transcriptase Ty1/copia-type domain-containing protein n=1 Tax=Sesamum latifolium TaxID=2727402 RepID=A0AAW2VZT3_9LAMI